MSENGLGDILPEVRARLIEQSDGSLLAKAAGIGGRPDQPSNQVEIDDSTRAMFTSSGAVEPPYDQEMLCLLFEHSSALRPPVDSYATNIDGFGYRLEPIFKLDDENDRKRISDLIRSKTKKEEGDGDNNAAEGTPVPSDGELVEELREIGERMVDEKAKLTRFFNSCCDEHSFVKLRRLTRQDLEVQGNAYWEILRNRRGQIAQFVYVPAFTIRLMPLDEVPTEVKRRVRRDDLSFETIRRMRRFRRFVQVVDKRLVYFKELGDPRLLSAKTGRYWGEQTPENVKRMQAEEGERSRPATEVKHFKIDSPRSAYGVPRWIGSLLSVMGSRMAEEVNFLYFDNKSVPPLAVLVSGGRISESSVSRIESYIQNNIKGKHNFHKILILEAEPAIGTQPTEASARMKIELRPLTGAQHSDALFQKYDERNIDKIGGTFRLPRLLRGDIRDFNRSTAMAALNFAEMQVFQPLREDFDWDMNNDVMNDMEVIFWRFVSRAPVTRDPVAMSEMIRNLSNGHVLVPEEGRELAEDVFNREFRKINEDWTKQPVALTLAGLGQGAGGAEGQQIGASKSDDDDLVQRLVLLRRSLMKAEEKLVMDALSKAHGWEDLETETITIPRTDFEALVDAGGTEET